MALRVISDLKDFHDKTVIVRIDTDVDIKNGKIIDDTRLVSSLETIKYITSHHGNVILIGHSGRPEGKVNLEYTLKPVAEWFAKEFTGEAKDTSFATFSGWVITPHISLLENLRFYKEEEENDATFAKNLASLGNIFVNEAFAVSHRKHASLYSVSEHLPSYAGFHLQKEVEALSHVLKNPKRPFAILIGGAKLETKLPLVEKMHKIADFVLVGGKIAEEQRTLVKVQHEKVEGHKSAILVADNSESGLDITEKDAENFMQILQLAKTIVWNGPLGKMGDAKTEENTLKIAKCIAESKAYTVVGGGDSLSLLKQHSMLSKFSFVSTGGGAMLEFLSGKELPGIKALRE